MTTQTKIEPGQLFYAEQDYFDRGAWRVTSERVEDVKSGKVSWRCELAVDSNSFWTPDKTASFTEQQIRKGMDDPRLAQTLASQRVGAMMQVMDDLATHAQGRFEACGNKVRTDSDEQQAVKLVEAAIASIERRAAKARQMLQYIASAEKAAVLDADEIDSMLVED
jgi:hypothetical protein